MLEKSRAESTLPPPPEDVGQRSGALAEAQRQQTKCFILLADESADPQEILDSFRRRPVEIDIFYDGLALLAELGLSVRNQAISVEDDLTTGRPLLSTIIFMVEPELNAETRSFMAVVRKYFPQVILLAHTVDPTAAPIKTAIVNTADGRSWEEVATVTVSVGGKAAMATVETPRLAGDGQAGDGVVNAASLDETEADIEVAGACEAVVTDVDDSMNGEELEGVFAPPSFAEAVDGDVNAVRENGAIIEKTGEAEEMGAGEVEVAVRANPLLDQSNDAKDERLVSEEELAMLLGNGDFLFDDGGDDETEAGIPVSRAASQREDV